MLGKGNHTRPALVIVVLACVGMAVQALNGQEPPASSPAQPFDQAKAVAELRTAIAGKEELLAVEVFKNIKQYKGVTASRLLRIMDFGFSRSLGVNCTHCHVPGQWEREDKVTKQITREMSAMVSTLNNEHLKKIPNLNSTNPSVNCTTCHRGQTRPALELPVSEQKAR